MGQALLKSPLFLLLFGTASLFVGAAFIYMSDKSPFFWGGLFVPGVVLLAAFVITALLAVVSMLGRPQ